MKNRARIDSRFLQGVVNMARELSALGVAHDTITGAARNTLEREEKMILAEIRCRLADNTDSIMGDIDIIIRNSDSVPVVAPAWGDWDSV